MNQTIGIVGLGLIGASLAKAVKAFTRFKVLGFDANQAVTQTAAAENVINAELNESNIHECGMVIVALYPNDALTYCKENFKYMKPGTVIVDCAGVKTKVCAALPPLAESYGLCFVGGHPMAGIERSGYEHSFAELFKNATMIFCRDGVKDESVIGGLSSFFLRIGFGQIKLTTAEEHDAVIAYTSQLAHLVSSAYIHGETREKRYGFSAGSFKDLTRVARLNENMWASLFFENRENLLKETDEFIARVTEYRNALATENLPAMKELLRRGTELKTHDDAEEQKWRQK